MTSKSNKFRILEEAFRRHQQSDEDEIQDSHVDSIREPNPLPIPSRQDRQELRDIAIAEHQGDGDRLSRLTIQRWKRKLEDVDEWAILSPFDTALEHENEEREVRFERELKSRGIAYNKIGLSLQVRGANRSGLLFVLSSVDRGAATRIAVKWSKSVPVFVGERIAVEVLDPVTSTTIATCDLDDQFVVDQLLARMPGAGEVALRYHPTRFPEGLILQMCRRLCAM